MAKNEKIDLSTLVGVMTMLRATMLHGYEGGDATSAHAAAKIALRDTTLPRVPRFEELVDEAADLLFEVDAWDGSELQRVISEQCERCDGKGWLIYSGHPDGPYETSYVDACSCNPDKVKFLDLDGEPLNRE